MQSNVNSLGETLERLFGIDIRALALTRILAATLILFDLSVRANHLTEHYGSTGAFPKEIWRAFWESSGYWSLHLLIDHLVWIATLFVLSALLAICLLLGYRTRVATIGLFALTLSLHNTNPLILTGADTTLRLLLFLGIFLPWNRAYSIDEAVRCEERDSTRVLTPWTMAYLLQVASIYLFAGFSKFGITWQTGTAVYYALSIDYLRTGVGDITYRYPKLMEFITISVLTLQRVSFVLFFSPFFTVATRNLVVVLLIGMHTALALHLKIGIFSWVSIAALIPFLPSGLFDFIERCLVRLHFGNLKIYYDKECRFCIRSVYLLRSLLLLPKSVLLPAQSDPTVLARMRSEDSWIVTDHAGNTYLAYGAGVRLAQASPILFWLAPLLRLRLLNSVGEGVYRLIAKNRHRIPLPEPRASLPSSTLLLMCSATLASLYILAVATWNISSTQFASENLKQFSQRARIIYHGVGLEQTWEVFAPNPSYTHGWVIPKITLHSGEELNLLYPNQPFTFDKPAPVSDYYPDWRVRKYLNILTESRYTFYQQRYLDYVCGTLNNRDFDAKIAAVEFVFMEERTLPDYGRELRQKTLGEMRCR